MAYYDDIKARPTVYKGIKMRSRLEASYAQWLDSMGIFGWEYEPQCFADGTGQYLPDFRVRKGLYVEIKPNITAEMDTAATRMHVVLSSEPDATLHVVGPVTSRAGGPTQFATYRACTNTEHDNNCGCARRRKRVPPKSVTEVFGDDPGVFGHMTSTMRCVACGHDCIHLVDVTCHRAGTDHIRPAVTLWFQCESCPSDTLMSVGLYNHKGTMVVEAGRDVGCGEYDHLGSDDTFGPRPTHAATVES